MLCLVLCSEMKNKKNLWWSTLQLIWEQCGWQRLIWHFCHAQPAQLNSISSQPSWKPWESWNDYRTEDRNHTKGWETTRNLTVWKKYKMWKRESRSRVSALFLRTSTSEKQLMLLLNYVLSQCIHKLGKKEVFPKVDDIRLFSIVSFLVLVGEEKLFREWFWVRAYIRCSELG